MLRGRHGLSRPGVARRVGLRVEPARGLQCPPGQVCRSGGDRHPRSRRDAVGKGGLGDAGLGLGKAHRAPEKVRVAGDGDGKGARDCPEGVARAVGGDNERPGMGIEKKRVYIYFLGKLVIEQSISYVYMYIRIIC